MALNDPSCNFLLALPLIESNSQELYELILDGAFEKRTLLPKTPAEMEDEAAGEHVEDRFKVEYPQQLSEEEMISLANALKGNTRMKKLTLHNQNTLDPSNPAVKALLNSFAENERGLSHIDFCHNKRLLTDRFFDPLLDILQQKNHYIISFKLLAEGQTEEANVDSQQSTPGMVDLIQYVANLNKFPIQLKNLAYRARANDSTLYSLELMHDASDIKVYNEESTQVIVDALERNNTVRTLKLDRCCPDVKCVKILARTVKQNPHLTRLSLADNRLTPEAALVLSKAILGNENSQIEELDLSSNPLLDDEAADALADVMKTNDSLRKVSIEGVTRVSEEAAYRLRAAAAFNREPPKLKHMIHDLRRNATSRTVIDLRGTPMMEGKPSKGYYTNLGARTLAEVLQSNNVVHTIDFSHNHIGPDGARSLANFLKGNTTITSLDVSHNPLMDEGVKHLLIALSHNDSLSECVVAGCECSEKLHQEVQAMCKLNAQPLPLKKLLQTERTLSRTDLIELGMDVPELLDGHPETDQPLCLDLRVKEQPRGKWAMLRASSVPYVLKILAKHREFTELTLTGNRSIGDKGIDQLCEDHIALGGKVSSLTKITLIDVGITDTSIHSLAVSLRTNYKLTSIVCVGNPDLTVRPLQSLDDALKLNHHAPPVKDMVPHLMRNMEGINRVDFSRQELQNKHKERLGDDTVKVICEALAKNDKVSHLNLSGQDLSNRGCSYLCDLLTDESAPRQGDHIHMLPSAPEDPIIPNPPSESDQPESEQVIQPRPNSSSTREVESNTSLGNTLRTAGGAPSPYSGNRSITSLDLSCNNIGPDGAKMIAFMIEHNSSGLKTLHLHHNKLQDVGVQEILKAVQMSNKKLTVLTVNDTEANQVTRNQVAAAVAYNSQMSEFRYEVLERIGVIVKVSHDANNSGAGVLDATAIDALHSGLAIHPTHQISRIELTGNRINLEGVKRLCTIVQEGNKISSLVLRDNDPGNPIHAAREAGGSLDQEGIDNKLAAGSAVQALRQQHHGPGSLLRPWNRGQLNEVVFRCVEQCPWLKELVLEEGGVSLLDSHVAASVALNSENHNFRSLFRRIRDSKDKDGHLIVPQAIDIINESLTIRSLKLLFGSLLTEDRDLSKIRLINFNDNDLDDEAICYLVDQLSSSADNATDNGRMINRAPLLQSIYLNGNPLGLKGLEALRQYSWVSSDLCVISIENTPAVGLARSHESLSGEGQNDQGKPNAAEDQSSSPALGAPELAAAGTAYQSIITKLAANKERLGPEKALVMTMAQRRVKASTGNPFRKSNKSDLNDLDVDTILASEAYSDMPKREKYFRGKYRKEHSQ